jgi:tetratricopeptide (TPR) repeat protein
LLKPPLLGVVIAASLGAAALAQDDADGLRRPERLTIGSSDQFLGTLSPDGQTLYFTSNRNTTSELFSQGAAGTAKLLFDEGADVSWPRVSPDGKNILYVSFREDATGQLCVRALPKGDRRCVAGAPGAVQAEWIDARRMLLVFRPSTQSDMRVSIVSLDGRKLRADRVFDRNLTSPKVSPNGRWLVYTPVERYVERIGPGFAAKAGRELQVQRLDHPELPPVTLSLDVPGLTGQPEFAVDGRSLYFVQFMSDSNQDGVIDAGDHGVLFRVPFEQSADDAPQKLAGVSPQQLTDAAWNCQYPSANRQKLIATCTRGTHLDVYGLPLDGVVPTDWTAAQLSAELDVATNPNELLLLHGQLMRVSTDPTLRRSESVAMIRLHLDRYEFDAAEFLAKHLAQIKDKATSGLGSAMRVLCAHRRALRARERGHLSLDFLADSRKRLDELDGAKKGKTYSPGGAAAHHIVRSEIADLIGDKSLARSELEAVVLDGITAPAVLELYADRADAFYREVDEREPLFAALRALSEHPAPSDADRLGYARRAARSLSRGLPLAESNDALRKVQAPADSDLAFAIELRLLLGEVQGAVVPGELLQRILALYARDKRPDRRRLVMLEAVQRGWEKQARGLVEKLAERYVDDAPKGTIERRRAARLYRRLIEDRAYTELDQKKDAAARDDFHAVARRVDSLESWAGYLDRRVREGATIEQLEAEYAKESGGKNGPVARFVRAYMLARKLPKLEGKAGDKAAEEAVALIRGAWPQLKDRVEAVSVLGAVWHERFLRTGDRAFAQRATALYLIALDVAKNNPRYKSMLLEQLGLVQAQVGNWRIALDYFDQREKLPTVDKSIGVTHRLMKARTLLHLDREGDAAKLADEALAMAEGNDKLKQYVPICRDRAALYNLAADKYERAIALYEASLPTVDADKSRTGPRNRLVVRLARAAAALGAGRPQIALDTLAGVGDTLKTPGIERTLVWPHSTERQVMNTYRLISSGLRAKAYLALDRYVDAQRELEARRNVFAEKLKREKVDGNIRALALVDSQLAEVTLLRKEANAALGHVKNALEELDPLVKKDDKPYDRDQLDLMWLAVEVRMLTDARFKLHLHDRMEKGIAALAAEGEPKRRGLQSWLEIYLGLLGPRRQTSAKPTATAAAGR